MATAPTWLTWLREFSPDLYMQLTKHMRDKPGCKQNRLKMLEVLRQIALVDGGSAKLEQFLRQHFHHVLSEEPGTASINDVIGEVPVFGHYDPALFTIPRRMILANRDRTALTKLVGQFLLDKPAGSYIIVGSRAYVEYLPPSLAKLVDKVPAQNWLTKLWQQEHDHG